MDMTTIIFALLAAFVVWKLRSVLGTRSGTERPPSNPFASRTQTQGSLGPRPGEPAREGGNKVITLPGAAPQTAAPLPDKTERWKPYAERDTPNWAGLDAIAEADPSFSIKRFLDGAKAAYEMIITAFASGNRDVLRNLLTSSVFDSFATALDEREKKGEKITTTFVSIDKITLEEAALRGRTAEIKLQFSSQMITATRDKQGEVIDGNPDRVIQVEDLWTFVREADSRDPNWKLAATGPAAH
ncbi:MAG TPA: Tim44/TimA family putative adaptor protein [Methylocella sp.]|nr:Tim44/TimA family putative adaptor protein [Methylocella sp.]